MLSQTYNTKKHEHFTSFNPALPSKVLDIRGDLITEFSMDEKREIVSFENISDNLIYALIAREDRTFFEHKGFNLKSISRAIAGILLHKSFGGGSTITQQIAGSLYCDRSEKSLKRKLLELWYAVQMERRFSKYEIMNLYLNEVYFGGGTYGVGAASRFYFGHSAKELTPAESALLVIQLSNPANYNPFEHPDVAKSRQQYVLDGMVDLRFITKDEAASSLNEYWDSFDYTRVSLSAWFTREDKARWFSEYVRRELESLLYGTMDIYADGYTVHTTCDLRHQAVADAEISSYIEVANKRVQKSLSIRNVPSTKYANISSLLALCCNVDGIHLGEKMVRHRANSYYDKDVAPLMDVVSSLIGVEPLKTLSKRQMERVRQSMSKNVVEGTLISIENETGYITSIVGGGKFNENNQLIRATQAKVQVGSTFKPLLYSAAIDSRKVTAATPLQDTPQVFVNASGVQYVPNNFSGKWSGTVLLYEALPRSLNIPAVSLLDKVGFEPVIKRAAALVGIEDANEIEKTFDRVYPLALGVASITPLQLARAFAIFGNQGKAVDPFAIRTIESRTGSIVLDVEKDMRIAQRRKGDAIQVISPQNAYIITSMLQQSLLIGTMYGSTKGGSKFTYKDERTGKSFRMPMAGKTGTTQNFTDSWTAAYSPYYTTVAWFGFDRRGQSLGPLSTGAGLASYAVANYMAAIHKGKPYKDFVRPETGLVGLSVCKKSGLLPSANCNDGTVLLYFLTGTQPTEVCKLHENTQQMRELGIDRLKQESNDFESIFGETDDDSLVIDPNVFIEDDIILPKENENKEDDEEEEDEEIEEVNPWL
ncbi:MAG: penicillin-binding protein 1A [Treponema sp.]